MTAHAHTPPKSRPQDVDGAVCFLDKSGQVQCNFGAPKRSRVLNPSPNGRPSGLPPGCSVNLATGRWAAPGLPIDGTDAKVQRVFTDDAGHHWAVAGDAEVVVPAVRAVAVGAQRSGGGRELRVDQNQPSSFSMGGRPGHPANPQHQTGLAPTSRMPSRRDTMTPEQQMMALQGVAPQQGVAVGACGPMAYNPAAAQQMAQYGQGGIPPNGGIPGCGPIPLQATVQDCAVNVECYTPMGVTAGVDTEGRIYPASRIGDAADGVGASDTFALFTRNGVFTIWGFKCFGGPNQVVVSLVSSGDDDRNFILSDTDCATWNTTDCFCRVDWGCASITNPVRMQMRAINGSTFITAFRGTLWGTRATSYNSCGPVNVCGPGGYGGYPAMGGMPGNGALPAG